MRNDSDTRFDHLIDNLLYRIVLQMLEIHLEATRIASCRIDTGTPLSHLYPISRLFAMGSIPVLLLQTHLYVDVGISNAFRAVGAIILVRNTICFITLFRAITVGPLQIDGLFDWMDNELFPNFILRHKSSSRDMELVSEDDPLHSPHGNKRQTPKSVDIIR